MTGDEYLKALGVEVWKLRNSGSTIQTEFPDVAVEQTSVDVSTKNNSTSDIDNMNLSALRSVVAECLNCQLSESRTNTVFGSGSESADLMFIGEAPGADEDQQGLPFVGRAGNLLTSMITALGYDRNDVYISNVVKCRPPRNRDPHPQEAKECSQYLRRQIQIISPKVIVALGRVSAQLLIDTELPLARLRGNSFKYLDTEVDLVVTYHPAYLLRKPSEKSKSWEDLWNVHQLMDG